MQIWEFLLSGWRRLNERHSCGLQLCPISLSTSINGLFSSKDDEPTFRKHLLLSTLSTSCLLIAPFELPKSRNQNFSLPLGFKRSSGSSANGLRSKMNAHLAPTSRPVSPSRPLQIENQQNLEKRPTAFSARSCFQGGKAKVSVRLVGKSEGARVTKTRR